MSPRYVAEAKRPIYTGHLLGVTSFWNVMNTVGLKSDLGAFLGVTRCALRRQVSRRDVYRVAAESIFFPHLGYPPLV